MKLTMFLLLLSVINVFAGKTYSQTETLNLNMRHTSVKEVLQNIENQSEFVFMYSEKLVNVKRKVSVKIEEQKINNVLDELFAGTNVIYKIKDRFVLLATPEIAGEIISSLQQITVSGIVTDVNGSPLPGVNVVEKGTTNGAVTNLDGQYSISISSPNATLSFSYIGFLTEEIEVAGQTIINLDLVEDIQTLDEVVVVGYGSQQKINLTGSVASINSDDLKSVPSMASTTNALTGRIPGLISTQASGAPGVDDAKLSIRGYGSALVIVDGVEGDFNNIDPNEIESISVLKDASAAIYGARAGNGVILVTTKRGKEGKPTITLNSTYTLQGTTNYPEQLTSAQYVEYDIERRGHRGAQQKFSQSDLEKYIAGNDPDYPSTDWQDVLMRPYAPMQQHNLSVSGGSEKIKYFGLIGYLDQQTFWKKNGGDFKRYNIRSNIDAKITNNLSLQLDFSNINEIRKFPARDGGYASGGVWHDLWISYPIYPSSLPDPTKLVFAAEGTGGAINTSNRDILGFADNDAQNIKAGVALKYELPFIKGLTAKLYINYLQNYSNSKLMNKPGEFYSYSYANDEYTLRGTWSPEADLTQNSSRNRIITNQFSFNYNRTFARDHVLSVLALYESTDYSYEEIIAARYHFLTPAIEYLFGGSVKDQYGYGSANEMGRKSYIGRLNYSFAGKYLFEATIRADASGKFPSEKRWGYFPSLSAGWRISEENFIKNNIDWLENLKLRGSISNTGYDDVSDFAYLAGYRSGSTYLFGSEVATGLISTGLANPNLTWEKISTYNAGLDFSIYKSTLYGEFDVFYRKLTGIPAWRLSSLPSTFGASLPPENLNSSNNRGFELMMGNKGNKGDLSWDISGNISWSRAKWDHYEEPDYSSDPEAVRVYQRSGQWTDRTVGYKTDGLFTSQSEIDAMTFDQDGLGNSTINIGDIKYVDLNNDGELTWKDRTEIGKGTAPHWMFGLSINLRYKNFDLSSLFQGAAGNQISIPGFDDIDDNVMITKQMFNDRWTEENNDPHATYPRSGSLAQGGGFSDFYLKKAGYIRLKTLNVGYNLPKRLLSFANMSNLRIYFAGTNLLTLDRLKKYGFDPEAPLEDDTFKYYPQQRTFTFGLNLTL